MKRPARGFAAMQRLRDWGVLHGGAEQCRPIGGKAKNICSFRGLPLLTDTVDKVCDERVMGDVSAAFKLAHTLDR